MEESDYKDFFNGFKKFKKIQKQQKKRGLNDFNILTTVLRYSDEVRLHSRMIGNLLNPYGKHYQDTLFLEKFLKAIKLDEWGMDLSNITVGIEYKDIDLYITDGNKHIIIENKIWAKDQPCQIIKYINIIVEENRNDFGNPKENDILDKNLLRIIYLTPRAKKVSEAHKIDKDGYIDFDGKEDTAKELSKCSNKMNTKILVPNGLKNYKAKYQKITYKKNIASWLRDCQAEVRNITNLNEVIQQYQEVVQKINKEFKGNVMTLQEYMGNNEELYDDIAVLENELSLLKIEIEKQFWEDMEVALNSIDTFENFKEKKTITGLVCDRLNLSIFRNHNLQYSVKNIDVSKQEEIEKYINHNYKNKVVTFAYIPDSGHLIDFEKGNSEFWKLGKKDFRKKIISNTVEIVNDIKAILDK